MKDDKKKEGKDKVRRKGKAKENEGRLTETEFKIERIRHK